jgi:hypothetical protein
MPLPDAVSSAQGAAPQQFVPPQESQCHRTLTRKPTASPKTPHPIRRHRGILIFATSCFVSVVPALLFETPLDLSDQRGFLTR